MPTFRGLPTVTRNTRHPDVSVNATFWRQDGTNVFTNAGGAAAQNTGRATSDIIAATTQKLLGNPIGTWSLNLVPRAEYFSLAPEARSRSGRRSASILPGDWCEIESSNGDVRGTVPLMYGPITDIRRRRLTNEKGAVITTICVSGADFGKALARIAAVEDVTLAQQTVLSQENLAFIAKALESTTGSPKEILLAILDRFSSANIGQVVDPKTGKPFVVDFIVGEVLGKALLQPVNLAGTLWQTLEQWANTSINELFCDLRPPLTKPDDIKNLTPAIVLRQYPFDSGPWGALPVVQVDRTEVINDDLGRSDSDVRNWIRPLDEPQLRQFPAGMSVFLDGVGAFAPESIRRFGLVRHENPTPYCYDSTKPIPDLIQKFAALQATWHHSNERLISGTLELYHRPDIRVGYRLDYTDKETGEELQFYVEGVQHAFNYPGRSSTVVTVTRGRDASDERFQSSPEKLRDDGILKELSDTITRIEGAIK